MMREKIKNIIRLATSGFFHSLGASHTHFFFLSERSLLQSNQDHVKNERSTRICLIWAIISASNELSKVLNTLRILKGIWNCQL